MLPELKGREIELKTKLYEAKLYRDFLVEQYTEEERNTTARKLVLENLAKRVDLTGRLWLYQDDTTLKKSLNLVEVTEDLRSIVDGATVVARSPVKWTQPEKVLGQVLDVALGREAYDALQILAKVNDLEEILAESDPFTDLETADDFEDETEAEE